jgi:hypothetical protein
MRVGAVEGPFRSQEEAEAAAAVAAAAPVAVAAAVVEEVAGCSSSGVRYRVATSPSS